MLKRILISLRNAAVTKLAVLLVSAVASIPIASLFYWSFDSSYLSTFGVGPEFYSRPVFSSDLIKTWVFVYTLKPAIFIICSTSAVILIVLLYLSYRSAEDNAVTPPEETSNFLIFINKFEKAGSVALSFLLTGLILILFFSRGFLYFVKEGAKLAQEQIDIYIKDGYCFDSFSVKNIGCYSIPSEQGNTQLLILNNEKHLIYMTRELDSSSLDANAEAKPIYKIQVVVKHKATNEKIIRQYIPSTAKEN